jgi:hypothetical protein
MHLIYNLTHLKKKEKKAESSLDNVLIYKTMLARSVAMKKTRHLLSMATKKLPPENGFV